MDTFYRYKNKNLQIIAKLKQKKLLNNIKIKKSGDIYNYFCSIY